MSEIIESNFYHLNPQNCKSSSYMLWLEGGGTGGGEGDCSLPQISDGSVVGERTGEMVMANFSCHPGRVLVGQPRLKCRGGQWSDSIPVCAGESQGGAMGGALFSQMTDLQDRILSWRVYCWLSAGFWALYSDKNSSFFLKISISKETKGWRSKFLLLWLWT